MTPVQKHSSTAAVPVRAKVREYLGVPHEVLDDVPVLSARFEPWRVISVQASLEALAERAAAITHGVVLPGVVFPDFPELLITQAVTLGPIDFVSKNTGPDRTLVCLSIGSMLGTWAAKEFLAELRVGLMSYRQDCG